MQEITATTINTIFTDIIDGTPDLNHIASSTRHAHSATNQHRARHHQHPRNGRNNYGRERGLSGVNYACTICKKDNHVSKNQNQAHIAHQVEVCK
jgi:hypothetical protein